MQKEDGVSRHHWNGAVLTIQARLRHKGRTLVRLVPLDFLKLGVSCDGLLAHCFNAAPAPMHLSVASCVVATLKAIVKQSQAFLKILSTPPHELLPRHITTILGEVDAYYLAKRLASGAALAEKVRNFLMICQERLANGTLARQAPYSTTLKAPRRKPRRDINSPPNSIKVDYSIPPQNAIMADNEQVFIKLAQQHYDDTLKPILTTCVDILDEHDKLVEILGNASAQPLPASLQARTVRRFEEKHSIGWKVLNLRNAHERLILAVAIADKNNLHIWAKPKKNLLLLDGIKCLDSLSGGKGTRYRLGTLLSRHYLSRHVVTACYVILLIDTRWNSDTLSALSADRIRRTAHGYEISSRKSKTNTNENAEIFVDDAATRIEKISAVRALQLLLKHDNNVTAYARRKSNSIFVSQNLTYSGGLEFDLFNSAVDFSRFTTCWNLASFNPSELRHCVERYHYLKEGMIIEKSRTALSHQDAATSEHYIGGEIAAIINEAHITRFMGFLEHAIFYQTGRNKIPTEFSASNKKTIECLLAPPSQFANQSDNELIEQLLKSPSEFNFVIGKIEAEQCARQRHYYLKNMVALSRAYPERFRRVDVPRIFICLALYNLVKSGPFRNLIEEIDGKLYGPQPT